ncbi:MAG: hypothetical protein LUC31_02440 [Coprobacillus sp.]|nr:hypothetical protein [Coprobacillus sp.]
MKHWYQKLNIDYQTSFWTGIIVIVAFLFTIPLLISGQCEYSLGLLLGGLIGSLSYFGFGLFDKPATVKAGNVGTVTILIVKYVLFLGLGFLFGFLYYGRDIHIFEPFTFIGGYFVSVVVLVVIHLVNRYKEKRA